MNQEEHEVVLPATHIGSDRLELGEKVGDSQTTISVRLRTPPRTQCSCFQQRGEGSWLISLGPPKMPHRTGMLGGIMSAKNVGRFSGKGKEALLVGRLPAPPVNVCSIRKYSVVLLVLT